MIRAGGGVAFAVPGEPKGKARPRLGRGGNTYTPRDTREYEDKVRAAFWEAVWNDDRYLGKDFTLTGPIRITIAAHFRIPKGYSKKKLESMKYPTKKPDADNIEKIICDALNGLAYKDDSQIVESHVMKLWTAGQFAWPDDDHNEPYVWVSIEELQSGAE